MTINDRFRIQLKVRFTDSTLDVRLLWLSELAMRYWMNMGRALTISTRKMWPMNCDFRAYEVLRIFAGVYCIGDDEPK